MPLLAGSRLGLYEIAGQIGAGGMGEVYRARDTKLGREVAIKVLPEAVEQDPERIARFEREAKALAALHHPNIATLFGMEQSEGRHYLVMELVEGEDLSQRLRRGLIPVPEALAIARQIADALETAHEHGIIHRDLKPANVKVTPDDVVKVLDFGLAKALDSGSGNRESGAEVLANSPTITSPAMTERGMIMGTAAYMSPEQAKGMAVDHRSDVFSFGCVLYELLSGRKAFPGDSVTDTLASVLAREPDWAVLPSIDPRLMSLLRRCLAKSRRQRWQALGDVRAEIEFIIAEPRSTLATPAASRRPLWKRVAPFAVTALVAAVLSGWAAWRLQPVIAKPVTRFSFAYPSGDRYGNPNRQLMTVSPDGSEVVFSTQRGLSIRSMATGASRSCVEGRPFNPAFSPDGRSVAFQQDGGLWRQSIAGGSPTRLSSIDSGLAISWGPEGLLVTTGRKILRVDPDGGAPQTLAEVPEPERVGTPQLLPGGQTLLLTIARGSSLSDWEQGQIVAQSLASGERRVLIQGGMSGKYVGSGHLVYLQRGVIFAAPFDVERLQITGDARPVVEGVMRSAPIIGLAQFSVGADGTLAYVPGPVTQSSGQGVLTMTTQAGEVTSVDLPPAAYQTPRFSPDGKSIAFGINDAVAAIWVYELSGRSAVRLLTFEGRCRYPIWSRDGRSIAFQMEREGSAGIYWQRADGTGRAERLTSAEPKTAHVPESVSPDGHTLLYSVVNGDRVTLSSVQWPGGNPRPIPGISSSSPLGAALSPDGGWIAYGTRGNVGVTSVFLEPYPPTGAKYQVSADDDAHHPLWSPDGSRLYYIPGPSNFFSVDVTLRPAPVFGAPVPAPRGFYSGNAPVNVRGHDLSPDGLRFVGVSETGIVPGSNGSAMATIEVVRNWFEELRQRVPVK
jgi:serine/threonine-protein kinase